MKDMTTAKDIDIPELLPPSEDGVFKTLLTHPDAEPVLRDVIESFLGFSVVKVEVRNVELPISDINEKRERFDVNCSIDDGSQAEIEMQSQAMEGDSGRIDHDIVKSRSIYYLCDLHAKQAGRGKRYDKLLRSFQITFCGYTVFPENEDFISRFSFRNEKGKELSNAVGIVFIELLKLSDIIKKPVEDMTGEEQWSIFFAYGGDKDHIDLIDKLCTSRSGIKMAKELLSTISSDERELALYRSRRRYEMDMEHNRAVWVDEGLEKGLEKGREEGREEGLEKGREETRVEIAKNLLETKLPLEEIVKVTGLTLQELEVLRDTH